MIVKLWDNFKYFALIHSLHALSACFCHGKSFGLERDNTVYSEYCIHIYVVGWRRISRACLLCIMRAFLYVKYNRKVIVNTFREQ